MPEMFAVDLGRSTACLYQREWSRFLHWCHGSDIAPYKATAQEIAEICLYLWKELRLLLPAIKGYRVALNHVFSIAGIDLAANRAISQMLATLKSYLPREMKPPEYNLPLILKSRACPRHEPLKMPFSFSS